MPESTLQKVQLNLRVGSWVGVRDQARMVLRAKLHHQGPPGLNELCFLSPSGDHMPPPVEANWPWSQVQMLPGGLLEA